MWNALKSDFSEFVSTVKEDTTTALSNLDDGIDSAASNLAEESLTPEQEECQRRILLRETFTAPLEVREDTPEEEAQDLETYLAEFSIDTKTDEIAALLENNEELKTMFESLNSEVEYADFWQRYFYRCDEDRIRDAWDAEEERAALARQQAVSKTIGNVTGFLGGAVKNIKATLNEPDTTPPPTGEYTMTQNQAQKAGIFNTRPPFVMNTAVDESGDDDEEELGWDDDDDEEEDSEDDEDPESSETQDEIEFKDPAVEKLKEELKQALEERDQLHQTVEMQTKEIAELQAANTGAPSPTSSKELEKLKMELFDKEAELAALRSSALDNSISGPSEAANEAMVSSLQSKVKELTDALGLKDSKIEEVSSALASAKVDLELSEQKVTMDRQARERAEGEIAQLQEKLANANSNSDSDKALLEDKVQQLNKKLASAEKASTEKTIKLTKESSEMKDMADALQAKLSTAEASNEQLQQKCAGLEKELAAALQRHKDECSDGGATGKSVDTATSAVKVEAPPTVTKLEEVDDDGDGWDDDW